MRLMLLGSRLEALKQNRPIAHGQTFWLDMLPIIAQKVEHVVVASIGGTPSHGGVGPVRVVTSLPFPLRLFYVGGCHGNEDIESNYLLKTFFFAGAYTWIQELVKEHGIDVIHVIENYGPIQSVLSRVKSAKTIFQPHYDPRYPIYDQLLRVSLRPFDAVITGSRTLAETLSRLGLATKTIEVIPWSVSPDTLDHETINQGEVKCRLGLRPDATIILWTGFITTVVGKQELFFSLEVAKQILEEFPDAAFVFAFKGQHFGREYKQLERDRLKIVAHRSRTEFLELTKISDLLFSPCLNRRAIVGPPLTWLECMAQGVPVVTTDVPGVNEIVSDDTSGVIMADPQQATRVLGRLLREPGKVERLAIGAKKTISEKFQVNRAADSYLRLWSSLAR